MKPFKHTGIRHKGRTSGPVEKRDSIPRFDSCGWPFEVWSNSESVNTSLSDEEVNRAWRGGTQLIKHVASKDLLISNGATRVRSTLQKLCAAPRILGQGRLERKPPQYFQGSSIPANRQRPENRHLILWMDKILHHF